MIVILQPVSIHVRNFVHAEPCLQQIIVNAGVSPATVASTATHRFTTWSLLLYTAYLALACVCTDSHDLHLENQHLQTTRECFYRRGTFPSKRHWVRVLSASQWGVYRAGWNDADLFSAIAESRCDVKLPFVALLHHLQRFTPCWYHLSFTQRHTRHRKGISTSLCLCELLCTPHSEQMCLGSICWTWNRRLYHQLGCRGSDTNMECRGQGIARWMDRSSKLYILIRSLSL